jgi:hypothetical protein
MLKLSYTFAKYAPLSMFVQADDELYAVPAFTFATRVGDENGQFTEV